MAGNYTRRITLYINGKQVTNDIKSIEAEMKTLQRTVKFATVGSKEYNAQMSQIRNLKRIISDHNEALNVTKINLTSLKGLANAFNKYWPVVMGLIGSVTGLAMAASNAARKFAEFDDRVSDVMKVTGLTRDEVIALNEEFKKIDTRTAQESLLELAYVAGKLGYNAREDVLEFVKAADIINVALGKDIGGNAEETIKQIGKLVEIFKLKDIYGMEEALLKVGSALNDLGMKSVASEDFLVQFNKRVAGIAPMVGVNVQNILGLAASLDILGQSAEVSATAYSKIMGKMASDTATFARLAGMSYQDFSKLLEEDANEAMLLILETIGQSEKGMQGLVHVIDETGLEGERMRQVLGAMAMNVKMIREQQDISNKAFEDGTSVITEFNTKNTNAQAILEKKKKEIANLRIELGEKLIPVYSSALDVQQRWMKGLVTVVQWMFQNRRAIISLVSAIVAYQVVLRGLNALKATQIILSQNMYGVIFKLQQVYYLLTGNIQKAKAAQASFNALALKNPWIAITAIIVAAGVAIWQYAKRAEDAAERTKKAWGEMTAEQNKGIEEQKVKLNQLYAQLKLTNPESIKRKEVIDQLNELYPDFLKNIDAEKASLTQLETVYRNYVKNLEDVIRKQIQEEQLRDLISKNSVIQSKLEDKNLRDRGESYEDLIHQQAENLILIKRLQEEIYQQDLVQNFGKDVAGMINEADKIRRILKQIKEEEKYVSSVSLQNNQKKIIQGIFVDGNTQDFLPISRTIIDIRTGLNQYIDDKETIYNEYLAKLAQLEADIKKSQIKIVSGGGGAGGGGNLPDFSEDAEQRAKNKALKDYLDGIIETKIDYETQLLEIQSKFSKGRLGQLEENSADWVKEFTKYLDVRKEMFEKSIAYEQQLTESAAENDPIAKENLAFNKRLKDLNIFHLQQQEMTQAQKDALLALEKEHQDNLDKIDADIIKKAIDVQKTAYEQQLADLKIANRDQLNEITSLEEAKQILSETMSLSELKRIRTMRQARKALQRQYEQQEADAAIQHLNQLMQQLSSLMESGKWEGLNLSDEVLSEEEKKEVIDRITEIKKEIAKLMGQGDGDGEDGKKIFSPNTLRTSEVDMFGFTPDDWAMLFENIENGILKVDEFKFAVQALFNAWGQMNELIALKENERFKAFEKNNQRKIELNEYALNAGVISEEAAADSKTKLEQQLDNEKARLARKQAIRERDLNIAMATMNAALAITKAYATLDPVTASIMAVIIAAATGTQIAIISNTEIPEVEGAEKGGYIDVKRAQDNKRFKAHLNPNARGFINSPTVLVGESGKLEYVIPQEGLQNPAVMSFVDLLENARLNGTLASINPYLFAMPSVAGRQDGGYSSPSTTGVPVPSGNNLPNDLMLLVQQTAKMLETTNQTIAQLNNILANKGISVSLTGPNGFYEKDKLFQKLKENASF